MLRSLGGKSMISFSTGSRSKKIEQVGPMINSRKITWIGVNMLGYFQPNNNGNEAVRIMGICIEII
jgi:hypothetical protein